MQFRQRHVTRLLALPAEHESPAFVMDGAGRIVASAGRTKTLFAKHSITRLSQIFGLFMKLHPQFDFIYNRLSDPSGADQRVEVGVSLPSPQPSSPRPALSAEV